MGNTSTKPSDYAISKISSFINTVKNDTSQLDHKMKVFIEDIILNDETFDEYDDDDKKVFLGSLWFLHKSTLYYLLG